MSHKKSLLYLSEMTKIVVQSIYILLMARWLGASEFGFYSVVLTIILIFTPFSGFGSGHILIKYSSVDLDKTNDFFNNSLSMLVLSVIVFFPVIYIISFFVIDDLDFTLLFFMFLFEFLMVKFYELMIQYNQVKDDYLSMAVINSLVALVRVIALIAIYLSDYYDNLLAWVLFLFFLNLPVVAFVYYKCEQNFNVVLKFKLIKEGLYFSLGLFSQMVYKESDKSIVHMYQPGSHVGDYSVANKIIDLAFTPIRVFYQIKYKGYFVAGAVGKGATIAYCFSNLKYSIPIALICSVAIYALSPFSIYILGDSYVYLIDVIKFLSILPLLRCLNFSVADCITGLGYQKARSIIQIVIALLSILLNIYFIKIYSWYSVLYILILCEVLMFVFFVMYLMRCK